MLRVLVFALTLALAGQAQDRSQARSMTISDRGIAATSQTLASQAGAQILARGGSAIDAAIAANATLGVVEPERGGIGGDLFVIYYEAKTGKLTGINASGWAPKALSIDFLKSHGNTKMPELGIHAVTVPGCVDGWAKLHERFGKLPWTTIFAPAIYYAKNGFPVSEIIQETWHEEAKKIGADVGGRRVYMKNGETPKLGEIARNPELGAAMELIASQGPSAFYRGAIAKSILKTSDRLGGKMTAADLAEFSSEWVQPVSTEYHGWKVYELPPNSQGIGALEFLNILGQFPLSTYPARGTQELHTQIEALKLTFADLHKYIADPRVSKVPVEGLISPAFAKTRAATIDANRAHCQESPGTPASFAGNTVYLAVVDREGNIASLIQSVYQHFGSGVIVDDYGFALQNRGALFELDANHPNALAGRKRPYQTIIPAFMEKGDVHIGFGIMGGMNQSPAHAQFVSNIVDHGMNIQAALEAPRFTKLKFAGCDIVMEARISKDVRDALTAKGHEIKVVGDFSNQVGGGQAVIFNSATGVKYGASDPRKDGAAIPEPHPYW
ncbi:MAG TPA: gamma-glutamyltransferase [Candidatus Solibacter sp.]|nr:gamma-glutamyltransferase [Candidatus Solibacter sp.]